MNRSFCLFAALLLARVALAAPAPEPSLPGWGKPADPDKDCKFRRGKDSLTIEMPGSDHDYDPHRKRVNAPRLLREFEGDFEIQMRVRIDCRPSAKSAVQGQTSYVSAGFLIVPPDTFAIDCIREEYRLAGQGDGADGSIGDILQFVGRGGSNSVRDKRWPKWPFKAKPDHVYLRLERWGDILLHSISPDGKLWVLVGGSGWVIGLPSKLKVGLLACSTSSEPSKVRFDQIQLIPAKKREPWDFVSGWGKPVDSDKDCKIQRDKDAFTIEMPGSDHDYDPVRKRFNAPRLLSDLEGIFDLQVRVRIDYRSSAESTVKGQPSFVSAGFLLIYPETGEYICNRVEFAVSQQGSKLDGHAVAPRLAEPRRKDPAPKAMEGDSYAIMKTCDGTWRRKGNTLERDRGMPQFGSEIWERGWEKWPLPKKVDCAYLRLEQREDWSWFFISPDGEKWTALTCQRSLPKKGKLALAACSTSTEPSKVRFDQLKLWRGKKKSK